jgi:hypothetical protein
VKTFEQLQQHSSFCALTPKIQTLLRVAFEQNPDNPDLLDALYKLNPKAKTMSMDIQLDAIRKLLKSPPMLTLLVFAMFDLDLSMIEEIPLLPQGIGLL